MNILSPTVLERWALSSTSDKVCIFFTECLLATVLKHKHAPFVPQFLYQVSIKDLVQKSIERDLPDPAAFAETVIEDAVPADQERLILLVRFTLLPSPIAYYMVVLLQLDGEGILILDKKQLSYQQELPNVSPHLQSFQKPRLGYVEHGAILFAFFRNAIVLTSSLPGSITFHYCLSG